MVSWIVDLRETVRSERPWLFPGVLGQKSCLYMGVSHSPRKGLVMNNGPDLTLPDAALLSPGWVLGRGWGGLVGWLGWEGAVAVGAFLIFNFSSCGWTDQNDGRKHVADDSLCNPPLWARILICMDNLSAVPLGRQLAFGCSGVGQQLLLDDAWVRLIWKRTLWIYSWTCNSLMNF